MIEAFSRCLTDLEMSVPSASQTTAPPATNSEVIPAVTTLVHAARLAIKEDKPVLFDYFTDTYHGKAFMGEDTDTKEKMLVKSSDEFTSLIQKVYKVQEDFIVMTENSIYLVSGKIQKRRIQAAQMRSANNPEYETLN